MTASPPQPRADDPHFSALILVTNLLNSTIDDSRKNTFQMESVKKKFESVTDNFRVNTTLRKDELTNIEATGLQDLLQAVNSIQKKQATDRTLMHMKRLDPFLRAIQEYGKVLEVVINASDFIPFIWVPKKQPIPYEPR